MEKKLILRLTFNPGLALTGFWTTWPWILMEVLLWIALDAFAYEPRSIHSKNKNYIELKSVIFAKWHFLKQFESQMLVSFFYPLKTFRPKSIALFLFSVRGFLCILKINCDSETMAQCKFMPAILFLFESWIIYSTGGG